MARMPDVLQIEVLYDPIAHTCPGQDAHNFRSVEISTELMLLYCTQCAMMLNMRFDYASGS